MKKEEAENRLYTAVLMGVEGWKPELLKEPRWGEDPSKASLDQCIHTAVSLAIVYNNYTVSLLRNQLTSKRTGLTLTFNLPFMTFQTTLFFIRIIALFTEFFHVFSSLKFNAHNYL